MKTINAVLIGTGAAANIGLGFVPDRVLLVNLSAATQPQLSWVRATRGTTISPEGVYAYRANELVYQKTRAASTGVAPFVGGSTIADGTSTYLIRSDLVPAYQGDMRAKTGTLVNGWTLGSSANKTGNFSAGIDTTYVGVGSRVCIGGRWATIVAITSTGASANDVTLDTALASGVIEYITYKSEFVAAPAGTVMPDGILVSDTAILNTGDQVMLEAGQYFL